MRFVSWEYDFLKLAGQLFTVFVLTLLPLTALVIFVVYMKKIVSTFLETHRLKVQGRQKK